MDIFDGLTALGGLCLFLFGMQIMAEALQRRAGGRLEGLLRRKTVRFMRCRIDLRRTPFSVERTRNVSLIWPFPCGVQSVIVPGKANAWTMEESSSCVYVIIMGINSLF